MVAAGYLVGALAATLACLIAGEIDRRSAVAAS